MENIQIEDCLNRLVLFYDKVLHLRHNLFYVQADRESKIIDDTGKTVKELKGEAVNFEKCGRGWAYTFKTPLALTLIEILDIKDNLEIIEIKDVGNYKHLSDNICAIEFNKEYYFALYGKQFNKLTPNIYVNVYLERESVNHIYVKVRREMYSCKPSDYSIIKIDKEGTTVSHLFANNIGLQEEYQALAISQEANGVYRYSLGREGVRLTNKTFTSLTCSNRSIDRGLIEVWEEDVLTVYKGLVNLSGDILIDTGKYGNIEETPFKDIFIVTEARRRGRNTEPKIGLYQIGKGEVIPCGTFNNMRLTALSIIAFKHTETGKEMYLGNDRNVHADISKAFPIYKLNKTGVDKEVYMVNVYGAWYTIDRNFGLLPIDLGSIGVTSTDWVQI